MARVRDISAGGAMIDRADALVLREGQVVEVEIHGLGCQRARVAWHESERVGLAFEGIVDPRACKALTLVELPRQH